jgi:hypothetical protein
MTAVMNMEHAIKMLMTFIALRLAMDLAEETVPACTLVTELRLVTIAARQTSPAT